MSSESQSIGDCRGSIRKIEALTIFTILPVLRFLRSYHTYDSYDPYNSYDSYDIELESSGTDRDAYFCTFSCTIRIGDPKNPRYLKSL